VVFRRRGARLDTVIECGRRLGRAVRPGDLVLLEGPLGAGKTTFVRAVAEELGVTDLVRSPSFTIANIYAGRLLVQHLDLYRLDEVAAEDALALEEYARADAVTLVEWPEAGEGVLGSAVWTVRIGHESLRTRSVEVEAGTEEAGRRWEEAGGP
jgi:tRNA threonylcarbamoyladenosine biosynthesis protein TsaE